MSDVDAAREALPEFDVEFDRTLGTMLTRQLSVGLHLTQELSEAEAALRSAEDRLVSARERVDILRGRFDRERELTGSMWEQLKAGIVARRAAIDRPEEAE